jgi:hypothetical protein
VEQIMTKKEWNAKKFNAGDHIKLTMKNGEVQRVQLSRGDAYRGHPASTSYPNGGPGMLKVLPMICLYDGNNPAGSGIPLQDIEDAELILSN